MILIELEARYFKVLGLELSTPCPLECCTTSIITLVGLRKDFHIIGEKESRN
jgi:hypothetical protein